MGRILLLGYFGADNFGDDALLADWLLKHESWLRERGLTCDVLSRSAEPLHNFAEAERLAPLLDSCISVKEAARLPLGEYTALIAPGGSLLQDTTSLRSLLLYLWVIHRFQCAGKKTFMLNQGLGPINSALGRFLTAYVLARCTLVTLRDEASYQWLKTHPLIARNPEVHLSADPILSASFESSPPDWLAARQPYALVIPKPTGDLPHRGDPTGEAEALAQLCEALKQRCGLKALLLPFHPSQDQAFCTKVAGIAHEAELTVPAKPIANSIWSLLGQASLVVSYRLHGLVSATALGVPGYGVAYDPKVGAFCDMAQLPWCYPAQVHMPETLDDVAEFYAGLAESEQARRASRSEMLARLDTCAARFQELW